MKWLLMPLFVGLRVVGFSCHAADIDMSHFVAKQVRVDSHSYVYRVFLPTGWDSKWNWPVVLFLHGSGKRGSKTGVMQLHHENGTPICRADLVGRWFACFGEITLALVVPRAAHDQLVGPPITGSTAPEM
jgi:hypothetical protein